MDLLFVLFWTAFCAVVLVILGTMAWGGLSAAPWVPLWRKDTMRMLAVAAVKPGETVVDLGAGDGRIIIAAARHYQAKGLGYEVAVLPYSIGFVKIRVLGLTRSVQLKYANFFKADLSQADVVCAFLTPAAMAKLKPKFEREIKPGARIVSYAFKIPDWQPIKIDKPNKNLANIYLYQKK